jgi:hypothetical protein
MRDAVLDPLSCDEAGHGYRLIASSTHNAEHRIMPRMPVNRLSGKGFRSTRSA